MDVEYIGAIVNPEDDYKLVLVETLIKIKMLFGITVTVILYFVNIFDAITETK